MRNKNLDILRVVAVLLVLGHHSIFPYSGLLGAWRRGGYVGVDLFFVLSGFLVSGLLFREYQKTQDLQVTKFLVRRAFKIYPAFYVLLLFSAFTVSGRTVWDYAKEALFVQNYSQGIFGHTWSLAVEEHAYVCIALLLVGTMRTRFREVPRIIVMIMAGLLLARCINASRPYTPVTHQFASHLRLDGIFFGVLLAYLWAFTNLKDHVARFRLPLATIGMVLLAPPFIWEVETTPYLYTLGFTAQTLGSGAIILAALGSPQPTSSSLSALAYLGTFSYSVYLVHTVCLNWSVGYFGSSWTSQIVYFAATFAAGIGLAKLIENPFIKLRDYLCQPTTAKATTLASA